MNKLIHRLLLIAGIALTGLIIHSTTILTTTNSTDNSSAFSFIEAGINNTCSVSSENIHGFSQLPGNDRRKFNEGTFQFEEEDDKQLSLKLLLKGKDVVTCAYDYFNFGFQSRGTIYPMVSFNIIPLSSTARFLLLEVFRL